jgi:hypothetical protein
MYLGQSCNGIVSKCREYVIETVFAYGGLLQVIRNRGEGLVRSPSDEPLCIMLSENTLVQ